MTGKADTVPAPSDEDEGALSLLALEELVNETAAPVLVVDLPARRICIANHAAADLFGASWPVPEQLLEGDLVSFVGTAAAERMQQALAALEHGAIRSYEGERNYADLRGEPVHAYHSVSRLELCDAPPVAMAIITPLAKGTGTAGTTDAGQDALVLATIGHDWRFDDINAESCSTLGVSAAALPGTPLLEAVHPDDASEILIAVARSLEDAPASTRVRFRSEGGWRALEVTVGPLCRHRPPQLALLLTPERTVETERRDEQARLHALERHVRRIAREVEATGVGLFQPLHLQALPMPGMSVQQQEVIARLLRGESIGQMADAMRLSRSTVRNHLSAIYRKLGVHSQAELIAQLTGRLSQPDEH